MDEKNAQYVRRKCDEEACRPVRRSVILGWNHIKENNRIPDEFSVGDLIRGTTQVSNSHDRKVRDQETDEISKYEIEMEVQAKASHMRKPKA
jgi:hypothetical protein